MAIFVELGMEDLKAYLLLIFLLSQRPDPKEKQVINLDQDVQVCGYFWWMVYELLLYAPSLLFLSFWIRGYLFFFDMPKHVAYLLWVCIFFDMPKHVAYLLWVCNFYFLFA